MTQLVKKAREAEAKIEQYMAEEGCTYDDVYERVLYEVDNGSYVLSHTMNQLADWSDTNGKEVEDGVIVEAYESVKDLMRYLPQVNVFYVTNCFKDIQILAQEGFTNITPVTLERHTDTKSYTVFSIRMERA